MSTVVIRSTGPGRAWAAVLRDVVDGYLRRPFTVAGETVIGHSADLRTIVYLMAGGELLVEGLMDVSIVPPAWRPLHLVWMALIVDLAIAFGAVTRRNPHRLDGDALRVRTGLGDEVAIRLDAVRAVRRERLSVAGRGLRPVPGRPGSVACNVGGITELVVELDEPVELHRRGGARLTAQRLHLAADDPAAALRILRAAVAP